MLIVNKMYPPEIGGIEIIVRQIAEINSSLSGNCTVLALNSSRQRIENTEKGITVIRLGSIYCKESIRWSLEYSAELKGLSKNYKTVLYNFPSFQPEFYKSKFNFEYKIVYYHADSTRYGIVGRLYQKIISRRFLSNSDMIIVSNPNIIQTSKALKGFEDKCKIIPYGIDSKHFKFKQNNERENILQDLNVSQAKLILFVGRLNRYKGTINLLKALVILPTDYKLVIVSTFELDIEMKDFIDRNNLSNRIVHYNKVTNERLPFYYSGCDVFAMPSTDRAEAFGLVAVEAMACGLPVITTELGTGTSFHNIDGITGRIIGPNDIDALIEAIEDICINSKNYDNDIIRARALDFSFSNFKAEWIKILKKYDDLDK